jgi:hypothetical protein
MSEKSFDTESVPPKTTTATHDLPSPALVTVPAPPEHAPQDAELAEITADTWESRNWLSDD